MRLKTIFTVNCVYSLLFGAGFILFPTFCSSLIGFNVAGDSYLIARCMGIFVLSTGILTFCARNAGESPARRAIVISLFALFILLFLYKVLLNLVYGIPFNLMLAVIYLLHLGFISAYGYHLFFHRD